MEWYGIFQESIGKEINMLTLELRPYDPESDELRNGWDALSVKQATAEGKNLHVDQFGDIWTDGEREYVGKVRKRE